MAYRRRRRTGRRPMGRGRRRGFKGSRRGKRIRRVSVSRGGIRL